MLISCFQYWNNILKGYHQQPLNAKSNGFLSLFIFFNILPIFCTIDQPLPLKDSFSKSLQNTFYMTGIVLGTDDK